MIKRAIFVLLSLLVGLSFILSIGAFGNNNVTQGSQSTTVNQQPSKTYFVSGPTNVIVTGYSETASVLTGPKGSTSGNAINSTLQQLESNGSISDYYPQPGTGYYILFTNSSTFGPYELQELIYSRLGANTPVTVNSTATILMPPVLSLSYTSQQVNVYPSQLNYTMVLSPPLQEGSSIHVMVHALVTNNGSIFNGQLTLSPV